MKKSNKPFMKTPFQKLNEILLDGKGITPGQMVMINSLADARRIELMSDLCFGFSLYNKPVPTDPAKKPMILRFIRSEHFEAEKARLTDRFESIVKNGGPTHSEYMEQCNTIYRVFSADKSLLELEKIFGEARNLTQEGYELKMVIIDDFDMIKFKEKNNIFQRLLELREFFKPMGTIVVFHADIINESGLLSRVDPEAFFERLVKTGVRDKNNNRLDLIVDVQLGLSFESIDDENKLYVHTAKVRGSIKPPQTATINVDDNGIFVYDVDYN